MKKVLILLVVAFTMVSCTQNTRAKSFGGTSTVELKEGRKLIEATWKEDNLWYLTRVRREGESIETYEFREESSFGMMNGTVIFKEN
jgi:hypothetical protein